MRGKVAKLSLSKLMKQRQGWRVGTIAASLVLLVILGQMIISKNPGWGHGASTVAAGEKLDITTSGFIWNNTWCNASQVGNSYIDYNPTNGIRVFCSGVDILTGDTSYKYNIDANADITISGTNTKVVVWGPLRARNLIIKDGATLTHAPLVYHAVTSGVYTHNFDYGINNPHIHDVSYYRDQLEQDFDYRTGAISANGISTQKLVQITAQNVSIVNGGKIDVTGKGYPGGAGHAHNWEYDRIVNDVSPWVPDEATASYLGMGTPNWPSPNIDETMYGGIRARARQDVCDNTGTNGTSYPYGNFMGGSGGGGYAAEGGIGSYRENASFNQVPLCASWQHYSIGGKAYGENLNYGTGGGSAMGWVNESVANPWKSYGNQAFPGGPGGGYISMNVSGTLAISKTSDVIANGSQGSSNFWAGGGGSGGKIDITAVTILINNENIGNNPDVTADEWDHSDSARNANSGANWANDNRTETFAITSSLDPRNASGEHGSSGTVTFNATGQGSSSTASNHFIAKGGKGGRSNTYRCTVDPFDSNISDADDPWCAAGGGSGGVIKITANVRTSCVITPDSQTAPYIIPAYCENGDVVIDNVQVITSGARAFNSLTIRNNGELTHDPLANGDLDSGIGPAIVTETGQNKKVDITLAGDLILTSGGKINVDGKGYPGAYAGATCGQEGRSGGLPAGFEQFGKGPGGGASSFLYVRSEPGQGAGAGYGGIGGRGLDRVSKGGSTSDISGGITYGSTDGTLDFGSGGGAEYFYHRGGSGDSENHYNCYHGGNGGGRVKIAASGKISIGADSNISANGSDPVYVTSLHDNEGRGGGGSGGTISLSADIYEFSPTMFASVDGKNGGGAGTITYVNTAVTGVATNLFASGGTNGSGLWSDRGGGGGGRILIKKPLSTKLAISIRKDLTPNSRPGASPANNFNPYALQLGDSIIVNLYVSNLDPSQGTKVTDEILHSPNTTGDKIICRPDGSYSSSPPGINGVYDGSQSVVWNVPATSQQVVELHYGCTVQKL